MRSWGYCVEQRVIVGRLVMQCRVGEVSSDDD